MNPANKPANEPCKVNPYHRTDNQCLRNSQCPFKDKPVEMRATHFRSGELVSIQDQYCSLCRSSLVPCPEVPPPPTSWPEWLRWSILGGLLLLLGGVLWWINGPDSNEIATPDPVPVCADGTVKGDTCVSNVKYQRLCNGRGGYRMGDKLGACGTIEPQPGQDSANKQPDPKPIKTKKPKPPIMDGYVVGKHSDGTCRRFEYKNGVVVGSTILLPEECNK